MKKNTYYFSHDFNANSDYKILYLRQSLGIEGYGIYWYIIENLANAGGKLPLNLIPLLAYQMQTSESKVSAVIRNFDLFQIIDEHFFSVRLNQSLDNLDNIKKINSEKGKKSAEKRKLLLTAVQPQFNNGSTKERKGKEIKGNESILNNSLGKKYEFNDIVNLPSNYIQSIQEQLYTLQKKKVDESVILKLWESFRLEKLTGEIFYNSEKEFFKHFVNWIKLQKFVDNGKSESDKRIEAMQDYANRYR